MRLLIGIIITLFVAVGIALILKQDPGYVLLTIGNWTVETSVAFAVVFLLVLFFLLYLLIRYLLGLWRMPRYVREATRRHRARRSQRMLTRGVRELVEGNWEAAESHLLKGVDHSRAPVLHYVNAAQAAQRLQADWRRNNYLKKARRLPEDNELVIGVTEAELQLEDGHPTAAKDILAKLRYRYPKNTKVLKLLLRTYRELEEWEALRELTPELRKRRVLDDPQLTEHQVQVYQELLAQAARSNDLEQLRATWKRVPKALRLEEALVIDYAGYLQEHDAATEAEALLRDALSHRWSDKLVVGYGQIARGDPATQLTVAENWLNEHEQNPHLLLTLGRLAKRARQWPKAKDYLERSLRAMPTPDAFMELGEVLEQLDDKEGANRCYRTGLRLLSGVSLDEQDMQLLPAADAKALAVAEKKDVLPAGETGKPPAGKAEPKPAADRAEPTAKASTAP